MFTINELGLAVPSAECHALGGLQIPPLRRVQRVAAETAGPALHDDVAGWSFFLGFCLPDPHFMMTLPAGGGFLRFVSGFFQVLFWFCQVCFRFFLGFCFRNFTFSKNL
jgi:hypothetical protein